MASTKPARPGLPAVRLSLPCRWLLHLLPATAEGHTVWARYEPAGPTGREWLLRRPGAGASDTGLPIAIGMGPGAERHPAYLRLNRDGSWRARLAPAPDRWMSNVVHPTVLALPGPMMLRLGQGGEMAPWHGCGWLDALRPANESHGSTKDDDLRLSRLAGGMRGASRARRLQSLDVAIVGAGRTGSHLLQLLAPLRLRSITLIDPDWLAPENLAAMALVGDADLAPPHGSAAPCQPSKVAALGERVVDLWPAQPVTALPCRAEHRRGLHALARADVIFTATDDDAPRAVAAAVASLFHRVHVDLGCHVVAGPAGSRDIGRDVRLVLPGEGKCLLCWGGVARPQDLAALWLEPPPARPWQQRRAGSLGWVNSGTAARAMELLDRLVCGELWHSTWVRDHSAGSLPLQSQRLGAAGSRFCPVCSAAGSGAAGLSRLREVLARAVGAPRAAWPTTPRVRSMRKTVAGGNDPDRARRPAR